MPCETPLLTPERVVLRRTAIRRRWGNRPVRPSRVRDGADPHRAWARLGRCSLGRTDTPSRRARTGRRVLMAPDEADYPWTAAARRHRSPVARGGRGPAARTGRRELPWIRRSPSRQVPPRRRPVPAPWVSTVVLRRRATEPAPGRTPDPTRWRR